ncbi:MAG: rRNA pseudouridine synthase [Treponema sp.]|nr:rRNA pseudouridine synthase [Treponema sp.]
MQDKEDLSPEREKNSSKLYLIMNKPEGYVCSAVSDSHKTVYQLLPEDFQKMVQGAKRGQRLHTIGRLDCDTSGLLLLTNDGKFSHRIAVGGAQPGAEGMEVEGTLPGIGAAGACGIEKTYRARLRDPISPANQAEYITKAARGLVLPPEKKFGEQKSGSARIHFLEEGGQLCEVRLKEGKFHEVRRIFRALGNEVSSLKRIAIGQLTLPPDLKSGSWRPLTQEEILLITAGN